VNYKYHRGQGKKGKDGFLFVGEAPNIPHIDVIENDAISDCALRGARACLVVSSGVHCSLISQQADGKPYSVLSGSGPRVNFRAASACVKPDTSLPP